MSSFVIYSNTFGPRHEYVIDFIFNRILKFPVKLTGEIHELQNHDLIINYSHESIKSVFSITPAGLLEESDIRNQEVRAGLENGIPFLFPVKGKDIHFDPFSAIFYMLSRYEEYLPHKQDMYGRYLAINSIAYRENFLDLPVVNIWIKQLAEKLSAFYPQLELSLPPGEFTPSIDIDNPWAFLHRSLIIKAGAVSRDILTRNYRWLRYRYNVLRGRARDPYDSYEYILQVHDNRLKIFYLVGNNSRYDNRISPDNTAWLEVIRKLSGHFQAGLHPSFYSYGKAHVIKREKEILENTISREISISRQHFLKLSLPGSYRDLISAGIKEDYSMGYPEVPGFRAGTSFSFPFYDLKEEKATDLVIVPFMVLDRTLKDYLKTDPDESCKIIGELMRQVKKFGGNFVSIWHNESLGSSFEWEGWNRVYDYLIKEAKELF